MKVLVCNVFARVTAIFRERSRGSTTPAETKKNHDKTVSTVGKAASIAIWYTTLICLYIWVNPGLSDLKWQLNETYFRNGNWN